MTGTTITNCFHDGGFYGVTAVITDINGCSNTAYSSANIYPKPIADFTWVATEPIFEEEVHFTDATTNATIVDWNWYFIGDATYVDNVQNPTFTYMLPGTYPCALIVKSDLGCIDTIVKAINVIEDFGIFVPNAFTPNGDGVNDIFQPKGWGIVQYVFEIYDRWGEKLFKTNEFSKGWDGTYQGKLVSQDDSYVWRIKLIDSYGRTKELTGHVTLIK